MHWLDSCPDVRDLQQCCGETCSDGDAIALAEHLAHCERCVMKVGSLHLTGTLLDTLRRVASATGASPGTDLALVIQRLGSLTEVLGDRSLATTEDAYRTEAPGATATTNVGLEFLGPPQKTDEIGRLGGYRILEVLGSGGMGVVLKGEDTTLRRHVAIKVMRPEAASVTSAVQRFLREARAVAALKHDNIITIYQATETGGLPFLVMEFLRGVSLEERMNREPPLPFAEIVRIGRETALGLAAAHAVGLIHRDIKPGNLWLENERGRVKILDFGLARPTTPETALTQHGTQLGTVGYMSPEQVQGLTIDARCDLFSLGCVLYRLATGNTPFRGKDRAEVLQATSTAEPVPPQQLNPALPASLAKLILQLLAKRPEDRPPTATAVASALRAIAQELNPSKSRSSSKSKSGSSVLLPGQAKRKKGSSAQHRPLPPEPPPVAPPRRWRTGVIIGVLVAVLFGLAGLVVVLLSRY